MADRPRRGDTKPMDSAQVALHQQHSSFRDELKQIEAYYDSLGFTPPKVVAFLQEARTALPHIYNFIETNPEKARTALHTLEQRIQTEPELHAPVLAAIEEMEALQERDDSHPDITPLPGSLNDIPVDIDSVSGLVEDIEAAFEKDADGQKKEALDQIITLIEQLLSGQNQLTDGRVRRRITALRDQLQQRGSHGYNLSELREILDDLRLQEDTGEYTFIDDDEIRLASLIPTALNRFRTIDSYFGGTGGVSGWHSFTPEEEFSPEKLQENYLGKYLAVAVIDNPLTIIPPDSHLLADRGLPPEITEKKEFVYIKTCEFIEHIPTSLPNEAIGQLRAFANYNYIDLAADEKGATKRRFQELTLHSGEDQEARWEFDFGYDRLNKVFQTYHENGWTVVEPQVIQKWLKQGVIGRHRNALLSLSEVRIAGNLVRKYFCHFNRDLREIAETEQDVEEIDRKTIDHYCIGAEISLDENNVEVIERKLAKVEKINEQYTIEDIPPELTHIYLKLFENKWNLVPPRLAYIAREKRMNRYEPAVSLLTIRIPGAPDLYFVRFGQRIPPIHTTDLPPGSSLKLENFISESAIVGDGHTAYDLVSPRKEGEPQPPLVALRYDMKAQGYVSTAQSAVETWKNGTTRFRQHEGGPLENLTVVEVIYPEQSPESIYFSRANNTPYQEPTVPEYVPAYYVTHFTVDHTTGEVREVNSKFIERPREKTIPPQHTQKEHLPEQMGLNAEPERIAREKLEKIIRQLMRENETIERLCSELRVLQGRNENSEEVERALEAIRDSMRFVAMNGDDTQVRLRIGSAISLLERRIAEEKGKQVPLVEPSKPWWRRRAAKIAGGVLATFAAMAAVFVPQMRKQKEQDPSELPPAIVKVDITADATPSREEIKDTRFDLGLSDIDLSPERLKREITETTQEISEAAREGISALDVGLLQPIRRQIKEMQESAERTHGIQHDVVTIQKGEGVSQALKRILEQKRSEDQNEVWKLSDTEIRDAIFEAVKDFHLPRITHENRHWEFDFDTQTKKFTKVAEQKEKAPIVTLQIQEDSEKQEQPTERTSVTIRNRTFSVGQIVDYQPLVAQPGKYEITRISPDGSKVFIKDASSPVATSVPVSAEKFDIRTPESDHKTYTIDGLWVEELPGDAYNIRFTTLSGKGVIKALATLILKVEFQGDKGKHWTDALSLAQEAVYQNTIGAIPDTYDPTIEYARVPNTTAKDSRHVVSTDSFVVKKDDYDRWVIESAHFSQGEKVKQ